MSFSSARATSLLRGFQPSWPPIVGVVRPDRHASLVHTETRWDSVAEKFTSRVKLKDFYFWSVSCCVMWTYKCDVCFLRRRFEAATDMGNKKDSNQLINHQNSRRFVWQLTTNRLIAAALSDTVTAFSSNGRTNLKKLKRELGAFIRWFRARHAFPSSSFSAAAPRSSSNQIWGINFWLSSCVYWSQYETLACEVLEKVLRTLILKCLQRWSSSGLLSPPAAVWHAGLQQALQRSVQYL